MTIAFAVMTARGRAEPTLNRSNGSFRAAGFKEHLYICIDGELPEITVDDNCSWNKHERIGNLKSWAYALHTLLATEARFLCIMQDDITWARNSAEVLSRELAEMGAMADGAGYLSLYVHPFHEREFAQGNPRARWRNWVQSSRGRKSAGAQCYLIPRQAALKLASYPSFKMICAKRDHNDDAVVSGCFYNMGLPMWFRIPGFVNHALGSGNSAIFPAKLPRNTSAWEPIAS